MTTYVLRHTTGDLKGYKIASRHRTTAGVIRAAVRRQAIAVAAGHKRSLQIWITPRPGRFDAMKAQLALTVHGALEEPFGMRSWVSLFSQYKQITAMKPGA